MGANLLGSLLLLFGLATILSTIRAALGLADAHVSRVSGIVLATISIALIVGGYFLATA